MFQNELAIAHNFAVANHQILIHFCGTVMQGPYNIMWWRIPLHGVYENYLVTS